MSMYRKLIGVAAVAALAFGLAACGGGGSDTSEGPPMPPPPTPYESAVAAIAAATTAADAQAAYDAVKDDVTASQGDSLQMRVNARIAAIDMSARVAEQQMAMADAAGMIDTSDLSTQAAVDAARMAIAGLRQAIADAVDVDDTSMYMSMLTSAVDAVDEAQGGIDTETRRTNQMTALSDASGTLQTALSALSGVTPTQAQLDAANAALADLNTAITDAADLTDTEKAPFQREADNAAMPIQTAQTAFDNAEDLAEEEDARNRLIAASRMRTGIGGAPLNSDTGTDGGRTTEAYGADGSGTDIVVTFDPANGENDTTDTTATLTQDRNAAVPANHDWEGSRYTAAPTNGGTYRAVVYSNVGDPEEGKKFGGAAANDEFEYALTNGALPSTFTYVAARVAFTGVTRTAGTETFRLPSPNLDGVSNIAIPGSYHGVSGTYRCTPAAGTTSCSATVAERGFTLSTADAWTFTPGNANARVTESDDTAYSAYGWWLHTAADGRTLTASAFADYKGTDEPASGLDTLQGSAKYVGGAAGLYSLFSLSGGTNDSGHFTARATLEASFTDNEITGTIDQFMGADGESRDWSVELMKSSIAPAGAIAGDPDDDTDSGPQPTIWTIDGVAPRTPTGQWSGTLREQGTDGVPGAATGTFTSTYANTGRIVGAFGANKE